MEKLSIFYYSMFNRVASFVSIRSSKIGIRSYCVRSGELPVTGSIVRDHLANERTFLAWARTSLVFVGAGIGLHQFYSYAYSSDDSLEYQTDMQRLRSDVALGSSALITLGFGVLSFATIRYYSVFRALKRNAFPPNVFGVAAFSICATSMMILGLFTTVQFPHYIFHDSSSTKKNDSSTTHTSK